MKLRLSLFLLAMIVLTAATVGFGARQLAQDLSNQQRDLRIRETQRELQNKFRSFDLFMQDIEEEMDQRLKKVLPKLAERIADGPAPAQWSASALSALAAEFAVRDIYLINADLTVFNTTFAPDIGLNLGNLSPQLKRQLQSVMGSGRVSVDRMSMSNKTGIIKKYAYFGVKGEPLIVEVSLNMWEGAETFGSVAQKRFFLEEFFQSLVDSSDILLEMDLFIADDLAQWSLLHEGVPMDPAIAAQLAKQDRVEIVEPNRLTLYNRLPRRDVISGFRFYSKTVFDSAGPSAFMQEMTNRTIVLTLGVALLAFLLVDRVIFRWLLSRVAALDSGIRRMAKGDLDAELPDETDDELGRIATAINYLARQVRAREGELQTAKEELEQRVAERTAELQESMETLAERESRYRYLVQHARSIILRWKPDGTITFFNEYAQEFFGYGETEALGQTLYQTIVPQWETGGRHLHQRMREIAEHPERFQYHENENVCRDERRVWVAWSNQALRNAEGEVTELLSVGADITHLKRVQQELILARDAADAANRAKSEFLAVMSHEIRTPMNAILGMAELLAETELSDEQAGYVRIFRSAGDTLLALINDILDLSRIEADRMELEKSEVDLEELCDEIVGIMSARARAKGLSLTVETQPGMALTRWGDPARLRQLLINLTGNAIKFTREGGVRLIVSEPTPGWARLMVEDSGIGIDPENQARVFEVFKQGDASVTRHYGGTGLGLAICRRLVELMGGSLLVESEPGRGSRFFFTVPMEVVERPTQQWDEPHQLQSMRVMLSGAGRYAAVAQSLLQEAGARVMRHKGCVSPEDLIAHPPDVLIVDLDDGGHDEGLACLQATRAQFSAIELPIVVFTAEQNQILSQRLRALQSLVLIKPVRRRDLLAALRAVIHDSPVIHETTPAIEARADNVRSEISSDAGETASKGPALRILLAEDSPDNVLLMKSYLKSGPYVVTVAENGRAALEQAQTQAFDLVIMDVQMPQMDGLEATRRIRAWEAQTGRARLPILALTAHAMAEDARKSQEAGCDAHLTKPIRKVTLLQTIEQLAARNAETGPMATAEEDT
ncbi:response regulator [Magnetofaba australis]|uniref:histidine kinase n=1 Tax=Magnetofaba australis IT-1 TaxID=1434232 RepID=A0A1Y2JZA5_9PROT|nr:response regulator [Magnetofaba australis]OSM00235.1 putative PAS/PAC sensor hybrid histidine kinase [Magnetofaba australis IT-1]